MRHAAILTVPLLAAASLAATIVSGAGSDALVRSAKAEPPPVEVGAEQVLSQPEAEPLQDAAKQAEAEVVVLHGTNSGKGIDPRIGNLPQLKQPPFSSYDSYQLLKRSKMPLEAGKAATMQLPDKGQFKLELSDVDKAKHRYILRASIIKPDGKKFLPNMKVNARAGDIFFIAGPKYKKGILVLGIRVRPKS